MSVPAKNEFLFSKGGINFNDLPRWQKRGIGLYWQSVEKAAVDGKTGKPVTARRRQIKIDHDLPMRDAFSAFVAGFLSRDAP